MIKKPVTLSDALQSHDETMIRRVKVVSVDGSMAYVRPINSNAGFDVQVSGSVAVGDVVDMQIVHGSRTVIGGTNSNVAVSSSATTVINTISQSISSTFSNLTGDVTSVGTLTTIATGVIVAADLANGTLTDVQVATANKDGIAGTPSLRTLGVGAQQAAAGNDSRLSDARTPLAHSTSHKAGGSDEIATTTPAAGAIPKADGAGKIDAWVTHPLASDPSITAGRVANVGTAITFMRSDATPIIGDSDKVDGFNASVTPTAGTIPVSDASGLIDGWVTPNPQGATPTGLAGTTAVAGTAATFIRSDGAPAINPAIAPTWTGVHTFANTVQTQSLIPLSADKYDIGSVTNNYRTVFATNISATVFIENTAQLFGGYLIVPKSVGSFPAVTGTGTTTINFGRNMTTGDIVVVRGVDVNGTFRTEYMRIGAVTTTSLIAGSPWMPALQAAATPINATYTVARDLKSSGGPWSFPKDTPFAIMGSTGDGRVEIESVGSDGPRISMTKLLDSTVTPPTEEEFFRVGDLNGLPNFITGSGNMGANVQGMYFGNSSGYMGYSAGSLVVSGKITAGSGTIGNWDIGTNKLSSTGVDLNSGASAGLAFGTTPPTSATSGTGIWLDKTGLFLLVPTPSAAPTAGTNGAGSVNVGTHSWVYTFVYPSGESTPSQVSNIFTVTVLGTNGSVSITGIAVGNSSVTARKIYRTVAGNTGVYKLAGTLADNINTNFADSIADGSLGANAPTSNATTISLNAVTGNSTLSGTIGGVIKGSGANGIGIGTTPPTSATVGTGFWMGETGLYLRGATYTYFSVDATTGNIALGNTSTAPTITWNDLLNSFKMADVSISTISGTGGMGGLTTYANPSGSTGSSWNWLHATGYTSTVLSTTGIDIYAGSVLGTKIVMATDGVTKLTIAPTLTTVANAMSIGGASNTQQIKVISNGSQTANVQEWQDGFSSVLASINSAGGFYNYNFYSAPAATKKAIDTTLDVSSGAGVNATNQVAVNINLITEGAGGFSSYQKALNGFLNHTGTGTLATGYGLLFSGGSSGNGNITNFVGVRAETFGSGTGVIANLSGFQTGTLDTYNVPTNIVAVDIGSLVVAAGTSKYGIKIGSISGATTNYAIYTNTGVVRFGDKVNFIATTTSAASLNVPAGTAPSAPVDGDKWNDSTQKAVTHYVDGIKQTIVGCIFSQTNDVTVANTVSELTMLGTGTGTLTLPANFWTVGKTVRVRLGGKWLIAAGAGTLRVRPKLGSIVMLDTAAMTVPTGATGLPWEIEFVMTCRTTGASGTVQATGRMLLGSGTFAATVFALQFPYLAAPTVNTTTSAAIDCTALWDTNSAARTITTVSCIVEVLN